MEGTAALVCRSRFVTKSTVFPLMVACSINEPDVIRTLIDIGADPELEDEIVSKQTALKHAGASALIALSLD